MAQDCTDAVETVLHMSQAALCVKNQAIDTLFTELDQLRRENELLVRLASAKGVRVRACCAVVTQPVMPPDCLTCCITVGRKSSMK